MFADITNNTLTRVLLIVACIVGFWLCSRLLRRLVRNLGALHHLGELRVRTITRLLNIGLTFCCVVVICLLLGLGYGEISLFLSSVFAVAGIALFAQWSILSNITASLILFFGAPYRVGDRIRILDKDGDMSGVIDEIRLFHILLKCDDGNLLTYPNALILQKGVMKITAPVRDAG